MQGNLLQQGKILIHILPELHNLRDVIVSYIKLVRAKWGKREPNSPSPNLSETFLHHIENLHVFQLNLPYRRHGLPYSRREATLFQGVSFFFQFNP